MKFKNFCKVFIVAVSLIAVAVFISGCGCSNSNLSRHEKATEPQTEVTETQPTTGDNSTGEAEIDYFDLE